MFTAGMDWMTAVDTANGAFDSWMTPQEVEARMGLLPATWSMMWHRGWNDTAAKER